MTALDISLTFGPDERVVAVQLGLAIAGVLALLAFIAALGAGIKPHAIPDVRAIQDAPVDDTCPRCGGTGEADLLDDFDIPLSYDEPCSRCDGTGSIGVAS